MRPILFATALTLTASAALAEDMWTTLPEPAPMPDAAIAGTAAVNGIEMYYALYGEPTDTAPILLIHGGLGHADIWGAQVTDLIADYQVLVADTRGHGRSTNDGSAYSIELLAQDYLALMDHLEIETVHLVGWSDGANIGYEISKVAPERLASHFAHAGNVTLTDAIDPGVNEDPVFGNYVMSMGAAYAEMSPTPDGFEDFLNGVAAMWFTDKPDGLIEAQEITVPTIVVHSQHDEAILLGHSTAIAEAMPEGELLVLEDVSHFAMLQDPDGYTAAIRAFVEE
ncbi:MAG: alpha/beta fold hydrolase [Pseudomonadota bacterium]